MRWGAPLVSRKPGKSAGNGTPGLAAGIGLYWAATLLVGYLLGRWVGDLLHHQSWGVAAGVLLGALGGMFGSIIIAKRALGD